jgi:hypothetical protein
MIIKFPKSSQVRIEQLRDEIRHQVVEFPAMAIQWDQAGYIDIEDVDGKATAHQAALQSAVDTHAPSIVYFASEIAEVESELATTQKLTFRSLPEWATWTPDEGKAQIQSRVLEGKSKADIDALVDSSITGTTLATLKPQIIGALKYLGGGIVALREIVAVMGYAILLLRDVVIRRTG